MWRDEWKGRTVWSTDLAGNWVVHGLAPDDLIYVAPVGDEPGPRGGIRQLSLDTLYDLVTMWPLRMYRKGRRHRRGGRLRKDHWFVSRYGGQSFIGERTVDGKYQQVDLDSHCLACAKSDILVKYGGTVDLRGWQRQGTCGLFLLATALLSDVENEEDDDEE